MTYSDIITTFEPKLLDITNIDFLISTTNRANFLIYGEIHGIQENAHVIYTLAHRLGIKRIAVEVSPNVKVFMDAIKMENYDFSLVDTGIFDSSILSIEVAKALSTLVRESVVKELVYIDTYFDNLNPDTIDNPDSPQIREQTLADNIIALDNNLKTLCIMGQWHTQPEPLLLKDGSTHVSAMHRLRQTKPNLPFIHNNYRQGKLYNDGREIDLPVNLKLPLEYSVDQVSPLNYNLNVPLATRILLP